MGEIWFSLGYKEDLNQWLQTLFNQVRSCKLAFVETPFPVPLTDTCSAIKSVSNYNSRKQPLIVATPDMVEEALQIASTSEMKPNSSTTEKRSFRAFAPLLLSRLQSMENEICANFPQRAEGFTKSSFANHLLLSLTNHNAMWSENGLFPESAAALKRQMDINEDGLPKGLFEPPGELS
jgi:hypothetical protein